VLTKAMQYWTSGSICNNNEFTFRMWI